MGDKFKAMELVGNFHGYHQLRENVGFSSIPRRGSLIHCKIPKVLEPTNQGIFGPSCSGPHEGSPLREAFRAELLGQLFVDEDDSEHAPKQMN